MHRACIYKAVSQGAGRGPAPYLSGRRPLTSLPVYSVPGPSLRPPSLPRHRVFQQCPSPRLPVYKSSTSLHIYTSPILSSHSSPASPALAAASAHGLHLVSSRGPSVPSVHRVARPTRSCLPVCFGPPLWTEKQHGTGNMRAHPSLPPITAPAVLKSPTPRRVPHSLHAANTARVRSRRRPP